MHDLYSNLINDYVTAQNRGNFKIFKSLFDEEVQKEIKKKDFFKSQTDIQTANGKIESTEYLTSVCRNKKQWLLFKVTFDNTCDEYLLTIVVNIKDKSTKALGIWLN